jgi:ATP-dependent Lon protease
MKSRKVLEIQNLRERLEHLLGLVEGEIDILQVEKRIRVAGSSSRWKKASASII